MSQLIKDIKLDMQIDVGVPNLYTITLVRNNQLRGLPNINIKNTRELETFYNEHYQDTDFSEVWFFKKKNSKNSTFSVGRISFRIFIARR